MFKKFFNEMFKQQEKKDYTNLIAIEVAKGQLRRELGDIEINSTKIKSFNNHCYKIECEYLELINNSEQEKKHKEIEVCLA